MIQLEFTQQDIDALKYERYHHPHPRVQRKMEALWLKANKLPHHEICRLVCISENTLRAYLRDFQSGGIEKVKAVNFFRPQSELVDYRQTLEEHFKEHPPISIKEAIAEIERLTGLIRSHTQVHKFFKKIGLRFLKVGQIPSKADPDEQEDFKKKSWNHVWRKQRSENAQSFLLMLRIL